MWDFYTSDGTRKVTASGGGVSVGDADTLDGYNSTAFVFKAGDTMLGTLTLAGSPSNNNDAANKLYVDNAASTATSNATALTVLKAGDTMTGSLVMTGGSTQITLPNTPTTSTHATNKDYVDTTTVSLNGDVMTGDLELSGTSSLIMDDASVIAWSDVEISRGGIGGYLEISAGDQIRVLQDPIHNNDLARKSYVDSAVSGGSTSLDDLTDVTLISPALGEVLIFDGFVWSNAPVPPAADTFVSVTSMTYTADINYTTLLCDSTSNTISITLPDMMSIPVGTRYTIKDASGAAVTNNVTIAGTGGELIDGSATYVLTTAYEWVVVVYDGTAWYVVG